MAVISDRCNEFISRLMGSCFSPVADVVGLRRLAALPNDVCVRLLQDVCIAVAVSDPWQLPHTLQKLAAVVDAAPKLEEVLWGLHVSSGLLWAVKVFALAVCACCSFGVCRGQ